MTLGKMNPSPVFLAEIADKEPPFWLFCALITVCAVVALPMWRINALIVLRLSIATISIVYSFGFILIELRDPHVGSAIFRELGAGYVATAYLAAIVSILALGTIVFRPRRKA